MSRSLSSTAAVLLGLCGCVDPLPPTGHLLVYIDTDAPLPAAAGVTVPGAPAPLFDRVRVELFAPGDVQACNGCVREFDLDEGMVNGGASLTVVAEDGAGTAPRARLRLFRGTPLGSEPARESTVELVIQLPEIPSEGRVVVTALLPTDAVGNPIGSLDAPVPASRGWSGGHAGTWPLAKRTPCIGQRLPGEVCIPGGAFWMGDRRMVGLPGKWAANVERLVVVSPFWLDGAETTVREFREAMTSEFDSTGTNGAIPWSGIYSTGQDGQMTDFCTFTGAPDPMHDRLPVNCVWYGAAEAYCAARGSRLPTEAELEFVGGAFASRRHPWGADEPSCNDAVWGRANVAPHHDFSVSPCSAPDEVVLPLELYDAQGSTRPGRDRVELPDGVVFDLAGNVSEWTSDFFHEPWEPCWNRPGSQVFVDPVCLAPGEEGEARAVRGGHWWGPAALTRAAVRFAQQPPPGVETGVRCVRSAAAL